jgi:hypothetical protein
MNYEPTAKKNIDLQLGGSHRKCLQILILKPEICIIS